MVNERAALDFVVDVDEGIGLWLGSAGRCRKVGTMGTSNRIGPEETDGEHEEKR